LKDPARITKEVQEAKAALAELTRFSHLRDGKTDWKVELARKVG